MKILLLLTLLFSYKLNCMCTWPITPMDSQDTMSLEPGSPFPKKLKELNSYLTDSTKSEESTDSTPSMEHREYEGPESKARKLFALEILEHNNSASVNVMRDDSVLKSSSQSNTTSYGEELSGSILLAHLNKIITYSIKIDTLPAEEVTQLLNSAALRKRKRESTPIL